LGLTNNPAARLRTPKKESRLPTVPKPQQAAELIAAAEVADSDGAEAGGSSAGTRPSEGGGEGPLEAATRHGDAAVLERRSATAVRVSELTELDRSDVDHRSAMITVLGKGNKERRVPFGTPAQRALDAWLSVRHLFARSGSGDALFLGVR